MTESERDLTVLPAVAELALLRAETLGEYDIAGVLGRGGMATVYLAHDIALDRKVAIKVIAPGLVTGPDMVERFKREARTAASLSHPNIIPIYSVRHTQNLLFFVMKLVEGRTLDSVLREPGPMPIPMIIAILGQVGGALGYAHRRNVIHRDIKPGNILLDEEGWCVVTDFGIAKASESEGLTTSGTLIGTPTYMSPEQCHGLPVSGTSDQYALGCVAYEMITGKPPFQAGTALATMYAHAQQTPVPIESKRPDCPPALRDAVMRMLAKEPAHRHASLEDAVASMGAMPLAHDDPTRNEMVALAKSGAHQRLDSLLRTPRSPIPKPPMTPVPGMAAAATPPALPAPRDWRRFTPIWGFAAAGLIAAAIYFGPMRSRAADQAATPATADSAGAVTGSTGAPTADQTASLPEPARPNSTVVAAPSPTPAAPTPPPAAKVDASRSPATTATTGTPTPGSAPRGTGTTAAPARQVAVLTAMVEVEQVETGEPSTQRSSSQAMLNTPAGDGSRQISPAIRTDIERALRGYADAMVTGDVDAAQRAWPTMPDARRADLSQQFAAGDRMSTRWRLTQLVREGNRITGVLDGRTTTVATDGASRERDVFGTVVFRERRGRWSIENLAD